MTTFNIKAEAEKLFKQYEEKTNIQLDKSYLPFIEYGMRQGILLAGMSLVQFSDAE